MPDLSAPTLTFRPGGARVVAYAIAVVIVVMTAVIGFALPEDITFTPFELLTLAGVLLAMMALLHGVGRSLITVGPVGLKVRNGFRDHHVPWSQVEGFSMNQGAPWPTLVTTDDERIMMFAIQGTDGPTSKAAVSELVRRHDRFRRGDGQ